MEKINNIITSGSKIEDKKPKAPTLPTVLNEIVFAKLKGIINSPKSWNIPIIWEIATETNKIMAENKIFFLEKALLIKKYTINKDKTVIKELAPD